MEGRSGDVGDDGREAVASNGTGIDITEVQRIEDLAVRRPGAMVRLFTSEELRDAGGGRLRYQRLASRFAAKEALIKAAGGLHGSSYRDIEVRRRQGAPPSVRVLGPLGAWLDERNLVVKLSLSHEKAFAVAMVFLVSAAGGGWDGTGAGLDRRGGARG